MKKLALALALACVSCAPLQTVDRHDPTAARGATSVNQSSVDTWSEIERQRIAASEAQRIAEAEAEAERLANRNATFERVRGRDENNRARQAETCNVAEWSAETCLHALCELRGPGGWVQVDGVYCEPLYRSQILYRLFELRPSWAKDARDKIEDQLMLPGLDVEQVLAAWGKPVDVNRTTAANWVREQWVYERPGARRAYVYIENGIVTTIQD